MCALAHVCKHVCICVCVQILGLLLSLPLFLDLNVYSHRNLRHQICSSGWVGFCAFLHQWHHILINCSYKTYRSVGPHWRSLATTQSLFMNSFLKDVSASVGAAFAFPFLFLRSGKGFRFLAGLLNPQEINISHCFYSMVFIPASFSRPSSSWAAWIGLARKTWPWSRGREREREKL